MPAMRRGRVLSGSASRVLRARHAFSDCSGGSRRQDRRRLRSQGYFPVVSPLDNPPAALAASAPHLARGRVEAVLDAVLSAARQ